MKYLCGAPQNPAADFSPRHVKNQVNRYVVLVADREFPMGTSPPQHVFVPETDHEVRLVDELIQISINNFMYSSVKLINISMFPLSEILFLRRGEQVSLVDDGIKNFRGKVVFQERGQRLTPSSTSVGRCLDGTSQIDSHRSPSRWKNVAATQSRKTVSIRLMKRKL